MTPDVVAAPAANAFCLLTMACCFSAALLARSVTENALMRAQSACVVLLPFLHSKKHDRHKVREELFNDGDEAAEASSSICHDVNFCNEHEVTSPAQNSTFDRVSPNKP